MLSPAPTCARRPPSRAAGASSPVPMATGVPWNASKSTPSTIAYSATMLGTSASHGECSPIAPARVDGSTMSVSALSNKRLDTLRSVDRSLWRWASSWLWAAVRVCVACVEELSGEDGLNV